MFGSAELGHKIDKATYDKYHARIKILKTLCDRLEAAL
jgi:hypothetical protein